MLRKIYNELLYYGRNNRKETGNIESNEGHEGYKKICPIFGLLKICRLRTFRCSCIPEIMYYGTDRTRQSESKTASGRKSEWRLTLMDFGRLTLTVTLTSGIEMMTASARGCRRRCSSSSRPQTLLSRITFFLAGIVTPTDTSQCPPPHRYRWVRPANFPPSHKHYMHIRTDGNKIDLTFMYPFF